MYNDYFDKKSKPPAEALKTITGGRLKNMTDIKPQWRNRAMTELYGLCGFGWKYTIEKQWSEKADNGEVICFTNINLFVKIEDKWSEAIPATGGSHLVELEKNYDYKSKAETPNEPKKSLYVNDEGYKMSLTDALSVAMQKIGIAGAIYEGSWNGSKYKEEVNHSATQKQQPPEPTPDEIALAEWINVQPPVFNAQQMATAKEALRRHDAPTIKLAINIAKAKNMEI
jgi:hypothetical protein